MLSTDLLFAIAFEPTYEELKAKTFVIETLSTAVFEPTYEELKAAIL